MRCSSAANFLETTVPASAGFRLALGLNQTNPYTMNTTTTTKRTLPEISIEGLESIDAAVNALQALRPIVQDLSVLEDPNQLAAAVRLHKKALDKAGELGAEMNEACAAIAQAEGDENRKAGARRQHKANLRKQRKAIMEDATALPA